MWLAKNIVISRDDKNFKFNPSRKVNNKQKGGGKKKQVLLWNMEVPKDRKSITSNIYWYTWYDLFNAFVSSKIVI